jgi:hypothetical protein
VCGLVLSSAKLLSEFDPGLDVCFANLGLVFLVRSIQFLSVGIWNETIMILRLLRVPPWPLALIALGWAWSIVGFFFFGLLWHSASHFVMAVVSSSILLGVLFRFRSAFWISSFAYAIVIGATVAIAIRTESLPTRLGFRLILTAVLILLQQQPMSLDWFGFQDRRRVRLWLWLFLALTSIVSEFVAVKR